MTRKRINFVHLIGLLESVSKLLCNMAKQTEAVIIAPSFRKSPEHKFPAGFDDCYAVASYFIKHAAKFSVYVDRIAISGDGTGGNLAAAVSHKLCNDPKSLGRPAFQYLLYPITQFSVYNLPSQVENKNDPMSRNKDFNYDKFCYLGYFETPRVTAAMEEHGHLIKAEKFDEDILKHLDDKLLPDRFRNASVKRGLSLPMCIKSSKRLAAKERKNIQDLLINPLLSPIYATNEEMRNLPTTVLLTCDCDAGRDEGILYYERLRKAGTDVIHLHMEKTPRGFLKFSKYSTGWSFDKEIDGAVLNYFNILRKGLQKQPIASNNVPGEG